MVGPDWIVSLPWFFPVCLDVLRCTTFVGRRCATFMHTRSHNGVSVGASLQLCCHAFFFSVCLDVLRCTTSVVGRCATFICTHTHNGVRGDASLPLFFSCCVIGLAPIHKTYYTQRTSICAPHNADLKVHCDEHVHLVLATEASGSYHCSS